PFIRPDDLRRGLDALESGEWAYAFTVTDYPAPIFRSFKQDERGGVEMLFPQHFTTRSQDLPFTLHDAGQFYWGRPASWTEGKRIFDRHSFALVVPRWRVKDIDNEEDWSRAEIVAPVILARGSAP